MGPRHLMKVTALKKVYLLAAALAILAVAASAFAGEARPVKVTVISTNDFHGYLEPTKADVTGGKMAGGAEVISTYINTFRDDNPDGFILVDAGDFMSGSLMANFTKGKAVVEFYNLLGYDAVAIGNHEFDYGVLDDGTDTLGTIKKRFSEAAFPILAANIYDKRTGKRVDLPNVKPFHIVERRGFKIGIIGITTVLTPITTHPKNIQGLDFRFGAEDVKRIVPVLKERGVNVIVVLAHTGGLCEPTCSGEVVEIARSLAPAEVDLIVSGHSHTKMNDIVNGIPVVQAYSKGVALGRAEIFLDQDTGKVLHDRTRIYPPVLTLHDGPPPEVGDPSLFTHKEKVVPDPKITKFMAMYREMLSKIKNQQVCIAAEPLRRRIHGESPVGVLLADAMRRFLPGVQIGMYNSGGIRSDLPAGKVTYGNVFDVVPFDNSLIRMSLTGEQVREIVEKGASRSFGLMAISGLEATLDMASKPGEKVKKLLVDGKPIDPKAKYVVVTNDFLLSGGDGFKTFAEGAEIVNTQTLIRDIFEAYLRAAGTVKPPAKMNYTLVNWPFQAEETP